MLKLYSIQEKMIDGIEDRELRLIIRYRVKGWSIRKIAKELHYSKSVIFRKIKNYYKGKNNEDSRADDKTIRKCQKEIN